MKRTSTRRLAWRALGASLALFALIPGRTQAQLNVSAFDTPYSITFDSDLSGVNNGAFTGAGFDAAPTAGMLNSNAWASTGMSDLPDLGFGGTKTTGDYARGTTALATITTGGFYAFTNANIGSIALGIKPGGSDWTPGTLTLRVQNNSGSTLASLDLAYTIWNNNSQGRSNSFNFSYSIDDVTYTSVAALDFTSPDASDANGFTATNRSTSITGLTVANGGYVYLRWSSDDVGGSGSRDEFALDDVNITGHGAGSLNTSVQFTSTSSSAAENSGTTNLALAITNPDAVNATTVTISATGATGRISSYSTSVTFPAGSSADENVEVTLDNNSDCNGDEDVTFTITGISGGQGTPYIGANDTHTLTVTDDESPADPVTTAGTAIASDGFTANWNAVNGASNYYLDVYTSSATVDDDFNDGDFSANPAWTGSTGDYAILTDAILPNGSASTDGSFLGSNASVGVSALTMASTETAQWSFSLGSGGYNPSNANYFGVILMSDAAVTDITSSFNGYYLQVGSSGSVDPVELWLSSGTTKTKIGGFPSSPDLDPNALEDGLDIRVTRSVTGDFTLYYATGFTYAAAPTTNAGTLTDNTYSTSAYFGVFTSFANPSADRRVYIDNIELGGSATYVPGYENFDAGTATSQVITGLDPLTTYHYRVRSAGGCSTGENSNVTDVTTLAGATPALTAGSLSDFGAICIGAESGPFSFLLEGFNLTTADVTVGPLDGFSFSTSELGSYTASLSITQPGGSFSQDIWVKFSPALEQSYSGDIPVGGGGAPGITVPATGSGLNTAPSMSTGTASNIGNDQAEAAGTIDDIGCSAVTAYGIEYSITENFTPGTGTQVASSNESGGDFSSVLTGLDPCTTYYFIAYATNDGGTSYGNQGSFTTEPIDAPVAQAGSAIGQDNFTANWDAVAGATGYRLDVSTSPQFGTAVNASDLFFSEYVEGGSNNKYVEVFNGTGASVDLSNYELRLYANGSPSVTAFEVLSGTLADGATIVYANPSATAYLGSVTTSTVVNFNGDDAFALYNNGTSSFADIIGTIGEDPGSAWTGAGGRSTSNKTLVRNSDVHGGVTTNPGSGFPTLETEWAVYAQDDVSHLGAHDFNNLVPSFVSGYEDLAVAGTSQLVSGLNTSTTYYYRVRAEAGACASSNSNTISVTTLACAGNNFIVAIQTDANGDQITWEVVDESNTTVATGGPYTGQNNTLITASVCLGGSPVDACYGLRIYDSFGDGLSGVGSWELRTGDGKVLLQDKFDTGYRSPSYTPTSPGYGDSHSFCLPPGPANILATECGIFNNELGNKVYCNKVTGATQYQFEFSDPDAGRIRRIARSTNYVHFSDMVTSPLTPGVVYFTRVRTNVAGPLADAHFGSGCEMAITSTLPCSELIQAPAYGHSCNETRSFNTNNSFIYAKPLLGGTEYQFHIYNTGEGYDQTFIRPTYILQLKWNSNIAPPLVNGATYNVEINVKVNGVYTGFCPSTCVITIDNSGGMGGLMEQLPGAATLWPNPVRDGQVNLGLTGLEGTDQQIAVDIQDIYGKQVYAKDFANNGESFSTILQLPGTVASGVYLVNITVNGKRTVQRLSIVR
jgi:hypothetical protein